MKTGEEAGPALKKPRAKFTKSEKANVADRLAQCGYSSSPPLIDEYGDLRAKLVSALPFRMPLLPSYYDNLREYVEWHPRCKRPTKLSSSRIPKAFSHVPPHARDDPRSKLSSSHYDNLRKLVAPQLRLPQDYASFRKNEESKGLTLPDNYRDFVELMEVGYPPAEPSKDRRILQRIDGAPPGKPPAPHPTPPPSSPNRPPSTDILIANAMSMAPSSV